MHLAALEVPGTPRYFPVGHGTQLKGVGPAPDEAVE
jgi:hypothetical protein